MASEPWPQVALPASAKRVPLPESMVIDGRLVQTQLFESNEDPTRVTAWFRDQLGPTAVENALGQRLVLGRAMGEYYVTVQLSGNGARTQGVVSMTKLVQSSAMREQQERETQDMLALLGPGTRVIQRVSSRDGGSMTHQWMFSSSQDADRGPDQLKNALAAKGYDFQRAAGTSGRGQTLYFSGAAGQAMATVMPGRASTTLIWLNLLPRNSP